MSVYDLTKGKAIDLSVKSISGPGSGQLVVNDIPSCKLSISVDQSIVQGAYIPLSFDTEAWDVGGFHSNVTNPTRITIPTGLGGKYLFTWTVYFQSAATASNSRRSAILVNTLTFYGRTEQMSVNGQSFVSVGSTIIQMSAGDYAELNAYQGEVGALNILANYTSLNVIRLSD